MQCYFCWYDMTGRRDEIFCRLQRWTELIDRAENTSVCCIWIVYMSLKSAGTQKRESQKVTLQFLVASLSLANNMTRIRLRRQYSKVKQMQQYRFTSYVSTIWYNGSSSANQVTCHLSICTWYCFALPDTVVYSRAWYVVSYRDHFPLLYLFSL